MDSIVSLQEPSLVVTSQILKVFVEGEDVKGRECVSI